MPSKLPFRKPPNADVEKAVIDMATDPKYSNFVEIMPDDMIKAKQKETGATEVYYPTTTGGKLDRFYIGFEGSKIDPQSSKSTVDLKAPSDFKTYVDNTVKFNQHQIQEQYDQKMYQLRQMKLTDEEYYNAVEQVKQETKAQEFEMRQKADATMMTMGQIDGLEKAGQLDNVTALKAKHSLLGLPAPVTTQENDPVKNFRQLDAYRSDLENRLKGFYSEPGGGVKKPGLLSYTSTGAFIYSKYMQHARPQETTVKIQEYDASTGKKVLRPATQQEQQERVQLMKELIRVRSLQVNLMEQSGYISPATAEQLKTANRLQNTMTGPTMVPNKNNDPLGLLR